MDSMKNLFPENLYHSYLIEGDPISTVPLLLEFLEQRDDVGKNNSDILCQNFDSFTIADTPLIKDWNSKRGISEKKKICIIGAKFINREAEQSLLKVIEEPKINSHLFLVIPNASVLLDTIKSRTHLVRILNNEASSFKKISNNFLKVPVNGRLEIIADLMDKNKNSENSGNLRFQATEIVNELERLSYEKFKTNKLDKDTQFILEELKKARMYLSTPGASVKMILEHIALVI